MNSSAAPATATSAFRGNYCFQVETPILELESSPLGILSLGEDRNCRFDASSECSNPSCTFLSLWSYGKNRCTLPPRHYLNLKLVQHALAVILNCTLNRRDTMVTNVDCLGFGMTNAETAAVDGTSSVGFGNSECHLYFLLRTASHSGRRA